MERTIDELKELYAQSRGFDNYAEYLENAGYPTEQMWIAVCEAYAKQERELAVEKALLIVLDKGKYIRFNDHERGTSGMRLDREHTLSLKPQIMEELNNG